MLQLGGLGAGEPPEELNITNPGLVRGIHKAYREAGADIITSNTFGANSVKLESRYSLEEIIRAAIANAKSAGGLTAMDIGPTGALLKPIGDMDFETAYDAFYEAAKLGAEAGADLIIIETMSDILEAKAAVLAAKAACALPVLVSMTFDKNGKALTGADPECMAAVMEGLGADAVGINCGLGPKQILPLAERLAAVASIPLLVQPNAGLPAVADGKTVYDVEADEFAAYSVKLARLGVKFIGGCCGTTPAHIRKTVEMCGDIPYVPPADKGLCVCTSYSHALRIGEKRPLIIGERINPTGKKRFREALKSRDFDYILGEASAQAAAGADALDVNVGSPDIDEREVMREAIVKIQAITDLPLQIDSSSPEVLEAAMRLYSGKPLVNSVNGKEEIMRAVFPLVKKYGGVVVGLTLDEGGIPDSPEGRLEIAERIVRTAAEYGIRSKDIIIDALTMTVAADDLAGKKTADALAAIKTRLGVKTALGVSNISFGLPNRPALNGAFLDMTVEAGLDCAIYNPLSPRGEYGEEAAAAVRGLDRGCAVYIEKQSGARPSPAAKTEEPTLAGLIVTGQKERAYLSAKELLKTVPALELINKHIIPALNTVGDGFESGKLFLPQLMSGADSAKRAFDAVREAASGSAENAGTVVIATVQGDIHDIGKNIVKLLLQNYGYNVVDLGRDVPIAAVVEAMRETGAPLLGLSALMTTTVVNMEKTIRAVRESGIDCKIMVGGAVLTESYAMEIGADYYAKDAMVSVGIANKIFGREQSE